MSTSNPMQYPSRLLLHVKYQNCSAALVYEHSNDQNLKVLRNQTQKGRHPQYVPYAIPHTFLSSIAWQAYPVPPNLQHAVQAIQKRTGLLSELLLQLQRYQLSNPDHLRLSESRNH